MTEVDQHRPGVRLVNATVAATVAFALTQIAADLFPDSPALAVAVAWALLLFVVGCVTFLWGFALAAGRSRDEVVTLADLVLVSAAPAPVRRRLLGALGAQVVIALATAAVRPFTPLAFGILAPVSALGAVALWGGRYGTFASIGAEPQAADGRGEGAEAPSGGRRRRWFEPVDLDEDDEPRRRR